MKKKKLIPFATIINKFGSGFFWLDGYQGYDVKSYFGLIMKTLDKKWKPKSKKPKN